MVFVVCVAMLVAVAAALFALGYVFRKTQSMALAILSAFASAILLNVLVMNVLGVPVPVMPFLLLVLSTGVALVVGVFTLLKTKSAAATFLASIVSSAAFLVAALSIVGWGTA